MRSVTLRDARKLGLLPGFSTIAKMEHKAQLERWKIRQMALAALTLPGIDGESVDDFMQRAYRDADKQAVEARDRGTHLHGALQGFYEGQKVEPADAPFVWPVVAWLKDRFGDVKWEAEKSFAHPAGYGGKSDLICRDPAIVVDFKIKQSNAMEKKLAYPEHAMQLTAYERGFGLEPATKINLFIGSDMPGLIRAHQWPDVDEESWEAFMCLLRLWQIRQNYDSSFERAAA